MKVPLGIWLALTLVAHADISDAPDSNAAPVALPASAGGAENPAGSADLNQTQAEFGFEK